MSLKRLLTSHRYNIFLRYLFVFVAGTSADISRPYSQFQLKLSWSIGSIFVCVDVESFSHSLTLAQLVEEGLLYLLYG